MKKKDLEYFRQLILNQRDEILKEMGLIEETSLKSTTKESSGNDATYSTHMADQGTDAQEREKAFYYAERDHKYFKHLNQALERIENGTFGICETCGEDISVKRLKARPVTTQCIECKTKEEASERALGL